MGCPIKAATNKLIPFCDIIVKLATRKSRLIEHKFCGLVCRKLQPNYVRQNKLLSCIPNIQGKYLKKNQLPCIVLHNLSSCKIPSFSLEICRTNKNSRGKHYVPCNMTARLHCCTGNGRLFALSDKLLLQPTFKRTSRGFQQEVWT